MEYMNCPFCGREEVIKCRFDGEGKPYYVNMCPACWHGYCPFCGLDHRLVEVRHEEGRFWVCPSCNYVHIMTAEWPDFQVFILGETRSAQAEVKRRIRDTLIITQYSDPDGSNYTDLEKIGGGVQPMMGDINKSEKFELWYSTAASRIGWPVPGKAPEEAQSTGTPGFKTELPAEILGVSDARKAAKRRNILSLVIEGFPNREIMAITDLPPRTYYRWLDELLPTIKDLLEYQ